MLIKLLNIFFCFVVFSHTAFAVNTNCSSLVPCKSQSPVYCNGEFLAIVKITRVVIDNSQKKQHNYFELVSDLNKDLMTPKPHTGLIRTFGGLYEYLNNVLSLHGFQTIDDTTDECGHHLKANRTYLIVSLFEGEGNKSQPILSKCNSWVELWDYSVEESNARLTQYNSQCCKLKHANDEDSDNKSIKNPGGNHC